MSIEPDQFMIENLLQHSVADSFLAVVRALSRISSISVAISHEVERGGGGASFVSVVCERVWIVLV